MTKPAERAVVLMSQASQLIPNRCRPLREL